MLLLQRYTGQSIQIGEKIKIVFLKQRNGSITLGIEAPKEIVVLRSELTNHYKKTKIKNPSI